ncbi:MAG: NAD-dependent epimerase/dehydratase family protein [Acidobacteria bacterium]|nr:MAG: NAD-dependent epimerase/dehydratase family protein [Acidobacteriota bacterium]
MKVLITGGAGFIGSHLAERYLACDDKVYVIDDLSTGSVENIRHLKAHKRFEYFLDSVENRQLAAELVDECDVIFHLAAAVGVRLIVESPVRTIETNVRATELVLNLAAKKKKRVLITSTSEVYGKRTQVPFREDDDLLMGPSSKGRWSYACSKALDEFLALAYWKEKRVPTTVVRLFNTVGPRQTGRYGMVVPNFVRQALMNEDITIFGDGTQRRCFLHVSDAVDALMALMVETSAVGEVYNVGSPEEITIRSLAEKVKAMTASSSTIVKIPYDEAYEEGFEDMLRRVPDVSKLNALTGFAPQYGLDDILKDVIAYTQFRLAADGQIPVTTDRRAGTAGRQIAWQPSEAL